MIFIKVIPLEQTLHGVSPQKHLVLLYYISIFPIVIIHMFQVKVVLITGWNIRSCELPVY
jgi:hypothetical protein